MKKISCLRKISYVVFLVTLFNLNAGYVTSTPTKAHLPSSLGAPEVTFVWDGNTPEFKGKETYADGAYANLSDKALMLVILREAASRWSSVPGSYLKLKIEEVGETVSVNTEDNINSIVTAKTGTYSAAANANPLVNDDQSIIRDCDIIVAPTTGELKFLLYAMVHEIGHCIGLGHAHDNYQAVMGYFRTPDGASLSADDKAGVISLYPDPAYGEQKEVFEISCGTIAGMHSDQSQGVHLLLLFMPIPFVYFSRMRRRHKSI